MPRNLDDQSVLGNEILHDGIMLPEMVKRRARLHGETRAFTFLRDGENEDSHLTYAALDQRAHSVAGWLQENGFSGQRVLLLYPSGLAFIAAFMGCLYAGAVAVPAYPPRMNRNVIRLRNIAEDAGAAIALTSSSILERNETLFDEAGFSTLRMLATDQLERGNGSSSWPSTSDGNSLAFLQYTSGSTSRPKGVMLSHANLMENLKMMKKAFALSANGRIVSWLPLFHDMGLIMKVLLSVYLGLETVIMPPEAFVMKPVRWLRAISRYRAQYSAAPDFAYELCVRRISEEQRRTLDLSCWESAQTAAEPVRHRTLERFSTAFAACGFRREALHPVYGLAEATVFVSGVGRRAGARTTRFDAAALERRWVVESISDHGPETRALVSCGHAWLDERIVIADPETYAKCEADRVGEIWVSGPNVARGYWNRKEESEHNFGARLSGEAAGSYLRTGDLGFVHNGGLFIAGRIKDLIIVAGRNHDPADIEHTVQSCHPAIRTGGCAAFQVEVEDEARLVIAAELERTFRGLAADDSARGDATSDTMLLLQAVREAVATHHDLMAHAVLFLKPGGLPKTSSGKVQRHACSAAYLAQTFDTWKPKALPSKS